MLNSKKNDIVTVQRAQYKNWCNNRRLSTQSLVTSLSSLNNVAQDSNGRSFPLPPELLLEVLSYLSDCQPALYSASLVCKQWLYCVAPILYCHPQINDTYRWATFILTLTRDRMSFFYGDLIRSIDLSSGKSIEAMKDHEFYRRLSNANDEQVEQQRISRAAVSSSNNNNNSDNRRTQFRFNGFTESSPIITSTRFRESSSVRFQQEQQEYLMKGLPFIIVSTSSLVQIAHTCKNITILNLSYTSLLNDSLVAETGEYLSTIQRYAVQPGLTHIQISIEQAIQAIGKECKQLQEVKIQRCEWVTAHVVWMFVYFCPHLKKLDARRSTKCTVKRLISSILEDPSTSIQSTYPISTSTLLGSNSSNNNSSSSSSSNSSNSSNSSTGGGDSSIVLPSSSSSSTVDVNNDFTSFFNESSNSNNNNGVIQHEENSTNTNEDDNVTVHFRFNEETGLYEQIDVTNQSRIPLVRHLTEDMDENNDGFWFVPLPTSIDDEMNPIGRRPPSPMHFNIAQRNTTNINKSLKNIVYDIITDAKELGAIDLNWLLDYQQ